ncbi:MAG TPA: FHA domain-containing protein, partial [Humibacter sp.]|nr:FHA domain-containing protein [Humibacter sp.]
GGPSAGARSAGERRAGATSYHGSVDKPGYIVPPPHLVPTRVETDSQTHRAPVHTSALPPFRPPVAAGTPEPADASKRRWRIAMPTGIVIVVDGVVLLGRNPVAPDSLPGAELVVVNDPAKTVSKTHAAFEPVEGGLRVTDLHSTNGVTVTSADGTEHETAPGIPTPVAPGSTVYLGRYAVRVDRA